MMMVHWFCYYLLHLLMMMMMMWLLLRMLNPSYPSHYPYVSSTTNFVYPTWLHHSHTNMDSFYLSRQSYENQSNSIDVGMMNTSNDGSIDLVPPILIWMGCVPRYDHYQNRLTIR